MNDLKTILLVMLCVGSLVTAIAQTDNVERGRFGTLVESGEVECSGEV